MVLELVKKQIMKTDQFLEIIKAGYIMSDETNRLFLELSKIEDFGPDYLKLVRRISGQYPYEYRFSCLLAFVENCLLDNLISEEETNDIEFLKSAFEIIAGDFYLLHRDYIMRIIQLQYHLYKLDNVIDFEESEEIAFLQKIFDLGSDQMSEFILFEDKN
jgi:hypothetical protein